MTTREQIEMVMRLVAERSGVTVADLKGRDRHAAMAWRRQVAMWVARGTPVVIFGAHFGSPSLHELHIAFRRHYTTIVYACRHVEAQMEINPCVKAALEALRAEVLAAVADGQAKGGFATGTERRIASDSVLMGVNGLVQRKNRVATL